VNEIEINMKYSHKNCEPQYKDNMYRSMPWTYYMCSTSSLLVIPNLIPQSATHYFSTDTTSGQFFAESHKRYV